MNSTSSLEIFLFFLLEGRKRLWTGFGGTWFHRDRGYASGQRPPLPWRGERARVSDGNAEYRMVENLLTPGPTSAPIPVILSAKSLIKPLLTLSVSPPLPLVQFSMKHRNFQRRRYYYRISPKDIYLCVYRVSILF